MEAERIIELFDFCWFELQIFKRESFALFSSTSEENPEIKIQSNQSNSEISQFTSVSMTSMTENSSSELSFVSGFLSPDSVLFTPKLLTVISQKEIAEPESPKQRKIEESDRKKIRRRRRRWKRNKQSKSMSDLEIEEIKGFMDLGFVFSEEDRDSNFASIVPGLKKGKDNKGVEEDGCSGISRPYLSEAWEWEWDVLGMKKKEKPLMKWRFPASSSEIVIKDSLRSWAHTVASTVS